MLLRVPKLSSQCVFFLDTLIDSLFSRTLFYKKHLFSQLLKICLLDIFLKVGEYLLTKKTLCVKQQMVNLALWNSEEINIKGKQ